MVDTALKNLYTFFTNQIKDYMIHSERNSSTDESHRRHSIDTVHPNKQICSLATEITLLEDFIAEHASTDQAYQIINFISDHLERMHLQPKATRKENQKALLKAKGNILSALLN